MPGKKPKPKKEQVDEVDAATSRECPNCGSSAGKKGSCPECGAQACSSCDLSHGCWNCGFEMGNIDP